MAATFVPTQIGDTVNLYLGDCIEVLRSLPDASVDAIVTDPPAGIAFMGKSWDTDKGGRDAWIAWLAEVAAECLRVAKPGAHALVWALPRTSHWTGMAWENAGWEPRDKIVHLFGTGFPKSLDVSKAIDKAAGETGGRGPMKRGGERLARLVDGKRDGEGRWGDESGRDPFTYAPATAAAQQWSGWGTALKPAAEDWWLLRKPLDGTVAANVLRHGTGALNIDGCRVEVEGGWEAERGATWMRSGNQATARNLTFQGPQTQTGPLSERLSPLGRWPANLITDGSAEVLEGFPETGPSKATDRGLQHSGRHGGLADIGGNIKEGTNGTRGHNDAGGSAARFFYCAKASRADREEGCDHLPARSGAEAVDREEGSAGTQSPRAGAGRTAGTVRNHHPTVKNVELMRYLCRLITPPGGLVLDAFTGSGSTGKGAVLEGFRFVGIERDPEYLQIAAARIAAAVARAPGAAEPPETATAPNGSTSVLTAAAPQAKAQLSLLDALDALDAL